jgi:hypothetical protein
VGKQFDSDVPLGTICRYYTLATDVDLGLDPYGNSYKYTLTYRPDRTELVQDDKNSPKCSNFIEREHQRVANRPTDTLEFRQVDDKAILITIDQRDVRFERQ